MHNNQETNVSFFQISLNVICNSLNLIKNYINLLKIYFNLKYSINFNILLIAISLVLLFVLHRKAVILASDEGEAKMLGLNVNATRLIVLLSATLAVASVVSMTGLISFVGLVAPHIAKRIIEFKYFF